MCYKILSMLGIDLIHKCNSFVSDMNSVSSHIHYKLIRFTDSYAILTVEGLFFDRDLFSKDRPILFEYIAALIPLDDGERFQLILMDENTKSKKPVIQKLKSDFRSGFDAAGAVAAAIHVYQNRKQFTIHNSQSLSSLLGFL